MVQGCEFRVRVMKGCVASLVGFLELRVCESCRVFRVEGLGCRIRI